MRHLSLATGIVTCLCLGGVTSARAATLTPDETLRITFTTDPSLFTTTPDLLFMVFTGGFSGSGVLSVSTQLFDGSTLLGTTNEFFPPYFFRDSASLLTCCGAATVDFSSILDGTIDGIVEFRIDNGTLTFGSPLLLLGVGFESSGWFSGLPGITSQNADIVAVPEPLILWQVGVGLVGIGVARLRRQRQRHS